MTSNADGMMEIADSMLELIHNAARATIEQVAEPSHARKARSSKQLVSILKSQLAFLLRSNLSDWHTLKGSSNVFEY